MQTVLFLVLFAFNYNLHVWGFLYFVKMLSFNSNELFFFFDWFFVLRYFEG